MRYSILHVLLGKKMMIQGISSVLIMNFNSHVLKTNVVTHIFSPPHYQYNPVKTIKVSLDIEQFDHYSIFVSLLT